MKENMDDENKKETSDDFLNHADFANKVIDAIGEAAKIFERKVNRKITFKADVEFTIKDE